MSHVLPVTTLLLIQTHPSSAAGVRTQLLVGVTAACELPGCRGGQVHASCLGAQYWVVHLQWNDQAALQRGIDEVLQPLLQGLLDNRELCCVQVYGGDGQVPPAHMLDAIEPSGLLAAPAL